MVTVLFFSSAVASAWGRDDMPMQLMSGEQPGLGTLVTNGIAPEVDGGDSAVLLKRCRECLGKG